MISALVALALAAAPEWLSSPDPSGLLRWRTVDLTVETDGWEAAEVEIGGGRAALSQVQGPAVLRLRGHFPPGCDPVASRVFGEGLGRAEVVLPLAASGADRLLVPPSGAAPGLPGEDSSPPLSYRFELPPGCAPARLRVYRAEILPDEYGPIRIGLALRRVAAAGLGEREATAWLAAAHPHRWQEAAAVALGLDALLKGVPGADGPARSLVRGLAEEAIAEQRAADPAFAWRTEVRSALPVQAVEGTPVLFQVVERGQAIEAEVGGADALRIFQRVALPPEETAPAAWRLRVTFDGRPPLPVLAVASRDPAAPSASRERSSSLAVPPGTRRVRIEPLDRQVLLSATLLAHKPHLEDRFVARSAADHLRVAALAGGDARGRLVALLARGRLGEAATLDEAAPLTAGAPGLTALVATWRAELEPDSDRAELLIGRARHALEAAGPGLEAALRPALQARLVRVRVRLDLEAGRTRAAAHALLGLAAVTEPCDEDADELWLADAFSAEGLDAGAHALAVIDGLLARRPLDRGLQIVRSRAFALASAWRGLAPEAEVREAAFLEAPPPDPQATPSAGRFAFAPLPSDGHALLAELAPPPVPGRRPVLSLIAVRGPALARTVSLRLDGQSFSLPVVEPFERFDLPVSPGRHEVALDAPDFAGEVLVNLSPATAPLRFRRYAEVPTAGLAFRSHEVGLPALGLLSLRVVVPAGAAAPAELELEIGEGEGVPVRVRLRPGPARREPRSELGAAFATTDPVEVSVPFSGDAAVIRIRPGPMGEAKLLVHLALRSRRTAAPPGSPAAGESPSSPASGDQAQALAAVWRESSRVAGTTGSGPLLARATALAELDELALAREDLLAALADPALGPHQRAFVAATWRSLDELGGTPPASVPAAAVVLSPSLALGAGQGPLGPGLLALLDDPAALASMPAAAIRLRAGEGREGDLAVLTAARAATAAGNRVRAATLWLDLAAAHPDVALLRRGAGEAVLAAEEAGPGPARAYLELFAATQLDPRDPAAQRLLRRAASRTRLRALRFADESAGSVAVRMAAIEELENRADAALLPPVPDADRATLVTKERQATVSFLVARPLRAVVRAAPFEMRPNEAAALGAPPIILEWVRDGEPPRRIACASGQACTSEPIDLVAGAHDLSVRLDGGLRPIARVWVDADRPTDGSRPTGPGPHPVVLDTVADHLVARAEAPVRLGVHGPALVKLEVRSPLTRRSSREVTLTVHGPGGAAPRALVIPTHRDPSASLPDGAQVSDATVELVPLEADALYQLELRPRSGDALVRLSVREGAGTGPGEPVAPTHAYRSLAVTPAAPPAGLATPPRVRQIDGDVVPGLDALGSLELQTGYVRRDENSAGVPVQASSAVVTGFAYRRLQEALHLTWKVAGDVRVREVGAPVETAFADAFFMHPEHRWLRFQGWLSAATQLVERQRAWTGRAGLMVEPVFTLVSGLHLVSKLGISASKRTLSSVPLDQLRSVDQDVFTRYDVAHARALYWEEGLEFEPFANTVLYANGRLTTNQGFSLSDQDHVSTTVLARALFGRTYAEASFRRVWYFVDADRPDPARRSTVFLSMFQTFWASERQHLVVGATTALHLDRRANEFTVYVAWEGSNGRRFVDHKPIEGEDYFFPQRGPGAERGQLTVEQ